ncbi:MAG: UPF0182 family protein [Chloroherpetonaceae bacterium]|nr:UPF0182 family protein [Chthonomonadaceae bacterium]MDW8207317.1 UPF0182 family protein [Chloroherpetonaceae bacterium]
MKSGPRKIQIVTPEGEVVRRSGARLPLLLFALLFGGFLLIQNLVPLYTDWLWFREVGYPQVFGVTVVTKTALYLLFGGLFFAIFYGNLYAARRLAPEEAERSFYDLFEWHWSNLIQRSIGWLLLGVSLMLALFAGRIAAQEWANALEFVHATPFGRTDPVFGLDIGFYVFRLSFLNFVANFLFTTFLFTAIAVIALHVVNRAIESWAGLPDIRPAVRAQLLLLAAGLALTHAVRTRFNAYGLLIKDNGQFTGPGYTDLTVRLFAFHVQTVLLILVGIACLLTLRRGRGFRWPVIGLATWFVTVIVLGGVVPGIVQKANVEPNQIEMERTFIARNIAFTRQGYGLENVRRVEGFPADESLNAEKLRANRDTIDSIRLWDHNYLAKVYNQLQTVKTYYRFEQNTLTGRTTSNIDVDRYFINGQLRQVMLAAREIDPDNLPRSAQTWQNRRMGYTHGYGVVMSPVNRVRNGEPEYFIEGFPPTPSAEASNLKVTRPEIYFGLLTSDYVFVDTEQPEFDYPATEATDGDNYTTYRGRGGIRIGDAPLAKLAFSMRLGDARMLLFKGFKPSTRVLIRRDVRERVQTVAPFLQLDSDPYLVVTDSGRLVWILDAYTLSDRYPYSTAVEVMVGPQSYIAPNYIRNSVKATVDAYDGTVNLYLADPTDPIAHTYARIFPGLLRPLSALGDGLRAHLRYPEDLFRLQRSVYGVYHVDDPRTFYLREDVWAVPVEPNLDYADPATLLIGTGTGRTGPIGRAQMEPYYVVMRLTDPQSRSRNSSAEFLLMSPLAPINREDKNILGWMCARCDGDRYGELVLYRFPQRVAVNGPSQAISLLNSEPAVSKELSLLRQGGSTARFGNLLVLPIETSLLYIAPLYIEATNSANIPQLQRVAVVFGQRVVMEETLGAALARLFPGYDVPDASTPSPPSTETDVVKDSRPPAVPSVLRALIDRASSHYETAQQKLKAGDFAGYGEAMKALERTLQELRRATQSR